MDNGTGIINYEDFCTGIIEKLFQFYNNNSLLKVKNNLIYLFIYLLYDINFDMNRTLQKRLSRVGEKRNYQTI